MSWVVPGEMAQQVRVSAVLPEDLSLIFRTYIGWLTNTCSSSSRRTDMLFRSTTTAVYRNINLHIDT